MTSNPQSNIIIRNIQLYKLADVSLDSVSKELWNWMLINFQKFDMIESRDYFGQGIYKYVSNFNSQLNFIVHKNSLTRSLRVSKTLAIMLDNKSKKLELSKDTIYDIFKYYLNYKIKDLNLTSKSSIYGKYA